jgi:hypothetical protein
MKLHDNPLILFGSSCGRNELARVYGGCKVLVAESLVLEGGPGEGLWRCSLSLADLYLPDVCTIQLFVSGHAGSFHS